MRTTTIDSITDAARVGLPFPALARAVGAGRARSRRPATARRRVGSRLLGTALAGTLSLGLSVSAEAGGRYLQTADLKVFGDPTSSLAGAVTLQRTHRGAYARISASGLDPSSAYTAWWVVFNNPEACEGEPCAGSDLRDPAVGGANFYATGFITGGDGTANVDARLEHGRLMRGVEYIDFDTGVRPRLMYGNGLRAEIHLVLRGHGPVEPGRAARQISSGEFSGCGTCANQQSAIFLPIR